MMRTLQPSVNVYEVAGLAFRKHVSHTRLAHYTGILSLHAYARLALITGDAAILEDARAHLLSFVHGEVEFRRANFKNYLCGGNGTAFLYWQGKLPEAEKAVRRYADEALYEAPRDADGIFVQPGDETKSRIWIDVAFAVTPFLLFAGLAFDEDKYIEEAYQQTARMVRALRNSENGLLHQARGFNGPGKLTQDHWSRGNGWGALALAELVNYLPDDDPRRPDAESLFIDLVNACIEYQSPENWLWYQEIPDSKFTHYQRESYVETSGSGLILYAIGVGLEKGILPETMRDNLLRGLHGYLDYIRDDGSVYHTCKGNRAPGDGSVLYFRARPPVTNDEHAFGPVILSFGQAGNIGITELEPIATAKD